MNTFTIAAVALAGLAMAAPAAAQEDTPGRHRGHSPQLGRPTAQTTGASAKAVRQASGGGVRHAPRAGDGKVKRAAPGATGTAAGRR